jgi:hypothetical protein
MGGLCSMGSYRSLQGYNIAQSGKVGTNIYDEHIVSILRKKSLLIMWYIS